MAAKQRRGNRRWRVKTAGILEDDEFTYQLFEIKMNVHSCFHISFVDFNTDDFFRRY